MASIDDEEPSIESCARFKFFFYNQECHCICERPHPNQELFSLGSSDNFEPASAEGTGSSNGWVGQWVRGSSADELRLKGLVTNVFTLVPKNDPFNFLRY